MRRTIDDFIRHYESLDENFFSLSTDLNPTDAWEWLDSLAEEWCLYSLIKDYGNLLACNDGYGKYIELGDSPKKRIVVFLYYVKRQREMKVANEQKKMQNML